MSADVKLLPLPDPNGDYCNPYDAEQMDAYARANLAERDAEVEALRADRDSWEKQASDRVADWHAEHLRAERLEGALRLISKQGAHYGPDGTRESWQHWAEIARAALEQESNDA